MPDNSELPQSYWCITWCGVRTYIDPEQARIARQQFESGVKMIEVEDIFGSTNWIPAGKLDGIWDSSPDMRQRSNAHEAMLKAEAGYQDD
jgi:hypothetical protein